MLAHEHADALASVGKCHLLRCGDHDGTRDGERLNQGQVDVAGARRHVDDEIVQFTPIGLGDELTHGVAGHGTAPQHGFLLVHKETDGKHLHPILLQWDNHVLAIHLVHIELLILGTEHLGH